MRRPNERVRGPVDHALAERLARQRKWRPVRWIVISVGLFGAFYAGRLSMPLLESTTRSFAPPLVATPSAPIPLPPDGSAPREATVDVEAGLQVAEGVGEAAEDGAAEAGTEFGAAESEIPAVSAGPSTSAAPGPRIAPEDAPTPSEASSRDEPEAGSGDSSSAETAMADGSAATTAAKSSEEAEAGSAEGDAEAIVELVTVSVNAQPWATIEVDGELMGVTPLAGVPLEPGEHTFRATLPDGRVVERTERINSLNRRILFR